MTSSFLLFSFAVQHPWIMTVLTLWVAIWKGIALWKAAQRNELYWFLALLVVNTLGLLEIVYIFAFAKKKPAHHAKKEAHKTEEAQEGGVITYDDFAKVELKVAKIKEAERVEKSEKLIKLQLEVGDEQRQIVAGIGKAYTPEDLINKEIVIVANLAPRALMGVESHGMLLAAGGAEHPVLLSPEKEVESGAKIK